MLQVLPSLSLHYGDAGLIPFDSGASAVVDNFAIAAQLANDAPSHSNLVERLVSAFDASQHPVGTALASYCLVTAADMVPFVPCQPLAVALGAKLGFGLAFPITSLGQTTAGVLAFGAARNLSNSPFARGAVADALPPETVQRLDEFRRLTTAEEQGDAKILLALIGLRLSPFFPFSAGNYLLGSTTSVPLRLFVAATLLGCVLSNFVSVSVGAAGGAMLSADILS